MGEGQNYETRWYYDTREERCRQFYYGGYGGNDNNFHDEASCLARCEQQQTTTTTQRSRPREEQRPEEEHRPEEDPRIDQRFDGAFDKRSCFLDYDSGECRVSEARYYYNKDEGICDVFAYGGCGGNANNFNSEEECEQNCGDAQDSCGLPPVYGQCQDNVTRWYYDDRSEECVEFTFSGCRGNKNNFYTEPECRSQCGRRSQPQTERTQAPPHSEVSFYFCSLCSFLSRLKFPRLHRLIPFARHRWNMVIVKTMSFLTSTIQTVRRAKRSTIVDAVEMATVSKPKSSANVNVDRIEESVSLSFPLHISRHN